MLLVLPDMSELTRIPGLDSLFRFVTSKVDRTVRCLLHFAYMDEQGRTRRNLTPRGAPLHENVPP